MFVAPVKQDIREFVGVSVAEFEQCLPKIEDRDILLSNPHFIIYAPVRAATLGAARHSSSLHGFPSTSSSQSSISADSNPAETTNS